MGTAAAGQRICSRYLGSVLSVDEERLVRRTFDATCARNTGRNVALWKIPMKFLSFDRGLTLTYLQVKSYATVTASVPLQYILASMG